jgi:hypothetical protein
LTGKRWQSGTSLDIKGRISKAGDPDVRRAYNATYSYDALNRPTNAVWNPAPTQTASSSSTVSLTDGYDGNNRRVSQSVTDNS